MLSTLGALVSNLERDSDDFYWNSKTSSNLLSCLKIARLRHYSQTDSSPFTPVGRSASVVIRKPWRRPSWGLWTL